MLAIHGSGRLKRKSFCTVLQEITNMHKNFGEYTPCLESAVARGSKEPYLPIAASVPETLN